MIKIKSYDLKSILILSIFKISLLIGIIVLPFLWDVIFLLILLIIT